MTEQITILLKEYDAIAIREYAKQKGIPLNQLFKKMVKEFLVKEGIRHNVITKNNQGE